MTFQEAKDAIRRAKPILRTISDLAEGLEKAAEMEKDIKALQARKVEIEVERQRASDDRDTILADVKALKAQYANLSQELHADREADLHATTQSVSAAKVDAVAVIQTLNDAVAKAEESSAQRIAQAEQVAVAAEARIVAAKDALEALKRA